MPLDRFVLIIVCVLAAAGATIWLGTLVAAAISVPLAWIGLIPALIVAYLLWRVIAERRANPEDDRYDRME